MNLCSNVKIEDYKQVASEIYGLDNNDSLLVTKFGSDKFITSKPRHIHQYGKWVSVKKDPPKWSDSYMGYSPSFGVIPMFYDAKENQWETYDGDYLNDVTDWMPLPKRPKEREISKVL